MDKPFVWADLSTFDSVAAKAFYHRCFGWNYQLMEQGYELCFADHSVAGLYTMPEKFQKMGMPSFWMSYIHVQDLDKTVREAEKHGGKIELRPQAGPGGGKIALIRDPSGAGFTCYEGEPLSECSNSLGAVVWNELHVSELNKIKPFYEQVFGWLIKPTNTISRYEIFAYQEAHTPIAGIQVQDNTIKGDKEYWGVYFSVSDLKQAADTIEDAGGEVVEQSLDGRLAILAFDSQGAAFYIISASENSEKLPADKVPDPTIGKSSALKWRAIAGLILVSIAIVLELNWLWGVFFLLWMVPDLKYGVTHFMEPIDRHNNPMLYWLIMAIWASLSVYLLFAS